VIRRTAAAAAIALACTACVAPAPRATSGPASGAEGPSPQRGPVAGVHHTISYDGYSLLIDGKRTYILSGEFHYWRLPSPDLWRDVLQ
jgi:hypothetical protein